MIASFMVGAVLGMILTAIVTAEEVRSDRKMFDMWVMNIKTKECKRVSREEATKMCELENIGDFRFYPCCPKDAPRMEVPEGEFNQLNLMDYEVR